MPSKEVKEYMKHLEAQGFECVPTKRNHIKVYLDGKVVTILPSTPSDRRWRKNAERDIRTATFKR